MLYYIKISPGYEPPEWLAWAYLHLMLRVHRRAVVIDGIRTEMDGTRGDAGRHGLNSMGRVNEVVTGCGLNAAVSKEQTRQYNFKIQRSNEISDGMK